MSYLGQAPGLGEAERFIFTASGSETSVTADGGGITLKGTTDKTLQWSNTTKSWEITPKLQQKGAFMKYSTNQSLVLGG